MWRLAIWRRWKHAHRLAGRPAAPALARGAAHRDQEKPSRRMIIICPPWPANVAVVVGGMVTVDSLLSKPVSESLAMSAPVNVPPGRDRERCSGARRHGGVRRQHNRRRHRQRQGVDGRTAHPPDRIRLRRPFRRVAVRLKATDLGHEPALARCRAPRWRSAGFAVRLSGQGSAMAASDDLDPSVRPRLEALIEQPRRRLREPVELSRARRRACDWTRTPRGCSTRLPEDRASRSPTIAGGRAASSHARRLPRLGRRDDDTLQLYLHRAAAAAPRTRRSSWPSVSRRATRRPKQEMIKANLRLVVSLARRYQQRAAAARPHPGGHVRADPRRREVRPRFKFSTYARRSGSARVVQRGIENKSRTIRVPKST